MKKYLLIMAILAAVMFFWLPGDSYTVSAQGRSQGRGHSNRGLDPIQWLGGNKHHPKWARGPKDTHGYRNYGQYRRTQVGNRRYRLVRRYYWRDGSRLSRMVRIFY